MSDDMALVREYASRQSDAAFETLVTRHVNLVYSVALRHVSDPHLAEEITQAVFIILARKAKSLGGSTILSAWLYRTARYASADALKMQRRRQRREQEAFMQSTTLHDPSAGATWQELSPLLDDAMSELRDMDRNAIVLRYFENKSAREIADALRVGEDAAQKRVTRALEKLRVLLAKRGVVSTTSVIAGAVSANSVHAAPVGLVSSISATVIKGSTAAASTLTLVKGTLNVMTWIKVKTAMLVGAGALVASAAVLTIAEQEQKVRAQEQQIRVEEQQIREQEQRNDLTSEQREKLDERLRQLRAQQNQLRENQKTLDEKDHNPPQISE